MDATLAATCTTHMDDVFAQLAAKQAAYAAALVPAGVDKDGKPLTQPRGKYLQLAATPGSVPVKDAPVAPDLTAKVAAVGVAWADESLTTASKWPCVLRVDEYVGPAGRGWLLTGLVMDSGVLWRRVLNAGPKEENYRVTQGWESLGTGL